MECPALALRAWCAVLVLFAAATSTAATSTVTVASPDGSVKLQLSDAENRLHYSVTFHDKPAIENSPMIVLLDGVVLTDGTAIGKVDRSSIDETYAYRASIRKPSIARTPRRSNSNA